TDFGKTLSNIVIPEGVTTIAKNAFRDCDTIASIEIPTTLSTFEEYAFMNTGIKKVYIKNLENYLNSNAYATNSPLCYGADLYLNGVLVEEIVIPDSVTSITGLAGCSSIKTIICGSGITSVATYTFSEMSNLTTVILSEKTVSLDLYAFTNSDNLERIVIKNPTISFSMYSIINCPSIKTIEFNGTVAQWQACVNGTIYPWDEIPSDCVVYCTD
ncbi:MAG: leucine-rich repeat domain-containing protein, partial [Clostridia bacterium]|nr:leucine-rich repeat domain-containing protein [Clostridia bacterium]